jgi:hypothetical protein
MMFVLGKGALSLQVLHNLFRTLANGGDGGWEKGLEREQGGGSRHSAESSDNYWVF